MSELLRCLAVIILIVGLAGCSGEKKDFIDQMEVEHENDEPVANASSDYQSKTQVQAQNVTYATVNGTEVTGYLATPKESDPNTPGIIVIHEWWGLNENIRMMTRRLAEQGYTALAVDLYMGESAESPDQAGKLARQAGQNPDHAISNLEQAYAYLNKQQNASNIGTIGWCFGGGWSLEAALAMPRMIDATVIYYGRLVTDTQQLKKLEMPILGVFGAEDSGIPPEEVNKFEAALNEVGVENSIHIYEGAGHAFANPSGNNYQKEAAEDAWQKTVQFLENNLNP